MQNRGMFGWVKDIFVGPARSLTDERLFHRLSLVAVFAWVGLGADGLSSSCYGPEEAFKALGAHTVLAPFVAVACLLTIAVLCASYSQIIEVFPGGGGGYLVASKLLSPNVGVVAGCALFGDYVLTIAISIASGADALFSVLPAPWLAWKVPFAVAGTLFLTLLNLRGVRESVVLWVPVFFIFLATHGFAIAVAVLGRAGHVPAMAAEGARQFSAAHAQLGWLGMALIVVRAYSVGAGSYTGIEAISNGLPILREPRVATGKRVMLYMGISMGFTVAGLLIAYLLHGVHPAGGKTLNALLFERLTAGWPAEAGGTFVMVAQVSAMALLFIGAQAGFLGGPRVLANMAQDRCVPSRFALLSDRLVARNGILLMGGAALLVILATRGRVGLLVVLYSISVFATFTLSQLGMVRHWWTNRAGTLQWGRRILVNGVAFLLTAFVLLSLSVMKFREVGWAILLTIGLLAALALSVRAHYRRVIRELARLDDLVEQFEAEPAQMGAASGGPQTCNPNEKVAVILVNGFNGLGVHTLLTVNRMFPEVFRNFVFVHAGVVDTGNFKGSGEMERLRGHVAAEAGRYVSRMRSLGFRAEAFTDIGTDIIETLTDVAGQVAAHFPQAVFFGGQLVFARDSWLVRLLHNHVVFALQRRLFRQGTPFLILPIRV